MPVLPGTHHAVTSLKQAEQAAGRIGFPLILKAAFGGGGRGMRIVGAREELAARYTEASSEALAAFGNGAVFPERYIARARHVEVQILGDRLGNLVHLGERDCSVQRRHQKVVEVAPAIGLDPRIRAALCDAAIELARAAGYVSAGTVEFLVDIDTGEWFFIEVNPRVQVEHTVTEEVTGIDIVRAQIQIAQGFALHGREMGIPAQDQIEVRGAALQCRVTTEDPANAFVPDYGRLQTYRSPAGFGIRLDGASAYGGAVITPYYDSLLVKVTARGNDMEQACQRMDRCLREFRIRGVVTNLRFLDQLIMHPQFAATRTFAPAGYRRASSRRRPSCSGSRPARTAPRACSATWARSSSTGIRRWPADGRQPRSASRRSRRTRAPRLARAHGNCWTNSAPPVLPSGL